MRAYIQLKSDNNDCFQTIGVELKEDLLQWQEMGLCYNSTGYGAKIPSRYKVKYNNRWYRIYIAIYGNAGSAYIISKGNKISVTTI